MRVPEGCTEADVVDAVERAISMAAHAYMFGYHTIEDFRQQSWVFALKLLEDGKFDGGRGSLPAFMYTHIRNKLSNYRRDNYRRTESPCKLCGRGKPCCVGPEGQPVFCPRHAAFYRLNAAKMSLVRPLDIEHVADEREGGMRHDSQCEGAASASELRELIDAAMPARLRPFYLRMLEGLDVPARTRAAVEAVILSLNLDGENGPQA